MFETPSSGFTVRKKTIGELFSILILLAVVLGAGIIVSLISSSLTQKTTPKGSALFIQRVEAYGTPPANNQIVVKVVASVSGSTAVTITSVKLSWNTNFGAITLSTKPQSPRNGTYLSPGSIVEIYASFQTASPPNNNEPVWITLEYCDRNGVCGSVIVASTLSPSQ